MIAITSKRRFGGPLISTIDRQTHPEPTGQRDASARQSTLISRDGLLCVGLLALCLLLTWPVAEIGVNDDWVYTLIAQDFARTGRFIFHGWASPLLGWQALWGAAFVKLFGASFTSVRVSTIPVALATALVYHATLRRFGLNRSHAIFGTLALVLSPLFIALSDTFMTDVPSLFAIVVCIYLCQRAIAASTDREAIAWLTAAALSNVALGTVRQIAWLGILVIVPSCGWLMRRRRYVPQITIALWIFGVLCVRSMMHWFARQPYTAPEKLIPEPVTRQILVNFAAQCSRGIMSTLLFLLPVLAIGVAALFTMRKERMLRVGAMFLGFVVLAGLLALHGSVDRLLYPWLGNVITSRGVMQDAPMFGSARALPKAWMALISATLVLVVLAFGETLLLHWRNFNSNASSEEATTLSWRGLSILLLPFLVSYCLLLLPRAAFFALFDRYLIEIVAILLIYILRWHQESIGDRVPRVAIAVLAVFAVVGVAATHDLFAIDRAEVRLVNELQQAGILRTEIRGGFAFDSTTQVYATGFINDSRIVNPAGAYQFQPPPPAVFRDGVYCGYPFLRYVPALRIKYVIAADPNPCLGPTSFAPTTYRTWLPTATRQLFVGEQLPAETAAAK